MRVYSLADNICLKADHLLRFLTGNLSISGGFRENPAVSIPEPALSLSQKKHIAGLMRVNYAGEVCAQALYQGQALTTKNFTLKKQLEKAGLEEWDHLYWCQSRLCDLGAEVSRLNLFWYAGSLLLGMAAGLWGDSWNLGFLEETEKQVVKHLDNHLADLPCEDAKTRAILEKMRSEEEMHAETAHAAGAKKLPFFIKSVMALTAKLMTKTAYWI